MNITTQLTRTHAIFTLISIAIIWGFAGPLIKDATNGLSVGLFLVMRFGVALMGLVVVSRQTLWSRYNSATLVLAFVVGIFNFVGYATQTIGLQTTTPGKASFIIGLSVVFVPLILAMSWRGHRCRERSGGLWTPVALSVVGLACLVGQDLSLDFRVGDGWMLLSALAYAVQIVLTGRLTKDVSVLSLATIQTTTCLLGSGVLALAEFPQNPFVPALTALSAHTGFVIVYLGLVAAAGAMVAQTWAQRHIPANYAALILCTEPVWGAIAGVLLAGERFTIIGLVGCTLMLLGMAWPELHAMAKSRSRALSVPKCSRQ
jgi:drug/metabolite transporter (DMT)-like permease